MDTIIVTQSRCKECGLCVAFCKQEALSFAATFTEAGYRPVRVDDEKCVKCGICYTMCPDRVFEIVAAPRAAHPQAAARTKEQPAQA